MSGDDCNKVTLVEVPIGVKGAARTVEFYEVVFGWRVQGGSSHAGTGPAGVRFTAEEGPVDPSTGAGLVVIYSKDLRATQKSVVAAGGEIAKDVFTFPGGSRFHFKDPSGNELAVWTKAEGTADGADGMLMDHHVVSYLEFPSKALDQSKAFFSHVFGWKMADFGPGYTSFTDSGVPGGFYKAETCSAGTKAPLVHILTGDLEAMRDTILASQGTIVEDARPFQTGHRIRFADPSGSEFAVWDDGSKGPTKP